VYSKINLGELMERQPGEGSGAGEEPVPGPGLPGGATPEPGPDPTPSAEGSAASGPGGATPDPGAPSGGPPGSGQTGTPDPGLAGFAKGGVWDSRAPSAALAAALEGAAGAGWRCEGGSRGEIVGALRAAAALESWWCAAKLGLIRAAIREDDPGLPGEDRHGDLPGEWSRSRRPTSGSRWR
jgi:hypothetical protein